MSFCPKCGREIIDEAFGCPVCVLQKEDDITQTENQSQPDTTENTENTDNTNTNQPDQGGAGNTNGNQSYQGGTWGQQSYQNNQQPQTQQTNYIQTPIKVMSIALLVLTGGIGAIVSLVCGIIMMKNDMAEYRKFGQLITIVSAAMLAIFFLCCILGVFDKVMDSYFY